MEEGLGGGGPGAVSHAVSPTDKSTRRSPGHLFEKKKKKEKKEKKYTFQIKGMFDKIRIFDWQTSPKHPNL